MALPKIPESTIRFLSDLKENNDRDWFKDNKHLYETAKEEFENFVASLILDIAHFDESISHNVAKKCIFRIYRDVRFSKDKSPYKTHISAHITPAKSKADNDSGAGYYIHIEPGASMLAGGAYQPNPSWLKNIREEIDYNGAEFRKIIESKNFKNFFGPIEGEKLKNVPKGYPTDHPDIEFLKFKSFLAVHKLNDQKVVSEDFFGHTINVFNVLHPFDAFLNRGLEQ